MNLTEAIFNNVWLTTQDNMQNIIDVAMRNTQELTSLVEARNVLNESTTARTSIQGRTAIVNLSGSMVRYGDVFTDVCGAVSTERVKADLEKVLADQDIDNIVLSVDSGGGMVSGTSELAKLVYENREKIVAHVKGTSASAAYWVSSAASKVYIEDTSTIGNIGAIMAIRKKEEDRVFFVSSQSKNKAPDPESDEGKKEYQSRIDSYAKVFIESVALHLGISTEVVVSRFGEGSVFVGQAAIDVGLADEIKSLEDVVQDLNSNLQGETVMAKEENEVVASTTVDADLQQAKATIKQLQDEKKDTDRIAGINAVLSSFPNVFAPDEVAAFISDKKETELTVSKAILEKQTAKQVVPTVGSNETNKLSIDAFADAIIIKAGLGDSLFAGETLHQDASKVSGKSMLQILADANDMNLNNVSNHDVAASMNTGMFPLILSNVQNKVIKQAYDKAPVTYRAWTKSVSMKDFKIQTEVRKGSFGTGFKKLSEGGSLEYGSKTEEGQTWRIFRYAKKFSISAETIINDDLKAFTDDLQDMIEGIERFKNKQVYDLLLARNDFSGYTMADGKAVFETTNHKNQQTTAKAVTLASLEESFMGIAAQKDFDGSQLAIVPKFLIVPFVKSWAVGAVINPTSDPDKNSTSFNPAAGKFNVIAEHELNGQTNWFVAADKLTIKTGYLESTGDRPIVELVRNSQIHGLEYEIAFDFGLTVEDFRGLYKQKGL